MESFLKFIFSRIQFESYVVSVVYFTSIRAKNLLSKPEVVLYIACLMQRILDRLFVSDPDLSITLVIGVNIGVSFCSITLF